MHALADGLARYLYNLSSPTAGLGAEGAGLGAERAGLAVFPQVHLQYLSSWLEFLSRQARSPQLLTEDHPVVTGLHQVCVCVWMGVCVCVDVVCV